MQKKQKACDRTCRTPVFKDGCGGGVGGDQHGDTEGGGRAGGKAEKWALEVRTLRHMRREESAPPRQGEFLRVGAGRGEAGLRWWVVKVSPYRRYVKDDLGHQLQPRMREKKKGLNLKSENLQKRFSFFPTFPPSLNRGP